MKLYRFDYSCYARKVQMLLDLMGLHYELEEVPYLERSKLVHLTQGYIQVPVLLQDDGNFLKDSKVICKALLVGEHEKKLVPSPWQGPIWAYSDWCDQILEDTIFRLSSPGIEKRFKTLEERALYRYVKERRYGEGCVQAWAKNKGDLVAKARNQLKPTLHTLDEQEFIFGSAPTLADAALYGLIKMVDISDGDLVTDIAPELGLWKDRLETVAKASQGA